jgi:hypothetical protein
MNINELVWRCHTLLLFGLFSRIYPAGFSPEIYLRVNTGRTSA